MSLTHHLERQVEDSRRFFWHRIRWTVVSRWFPRNRPFLLLDIGAGAGFAGDYLKRDFPQATYSFIEPIESLSAHLEKVHGAGSNAARLTRFDGVDVVTLLDVLEHQENDRGFLDDILGKMPRGARLILTVPAFRWLWSPWDDNLGHKRRYNKRTLLTLFDGRPARVLSCAYFFPELLPLGVWRTFRANRASVEFPSLPGPINFFFYALSRLFLPLARFLPFGTSLVLVAEKNAD